MKIKLLLLILFLALTTVVDAKGRLTAAQTTHKQQRLSKSNRNVVKRTKHKPYQYFNRQRQCRANQHYYQYDGMRNRFKNDRSFIQYENWDRRPKSKPLLRRILCK